MSKTLFSLLFLSCTLLALEFTSYQEARKLQKINGKTIMIDVVRTNCHYCTDMERDVLRKPQMSKYLGEKFIPVKINLDKETLPLGLKVHFTPTFIFVDKDENILKKIPGSWSEKDFKELTTAIK